MAHLPVSNFSRCWPKESGGKAIWPIVCRMKFCWSKFWSRPKASIGQINALSVIEFPASAFMGESSRISCVVHIGDGEFTDIERKAELVKHPRQSGMMIIMQAFLMSELQLEQQIPFASLTFEQPYSEVDGDSASMAELCALISAPAEVPINQNIAITGSVRSNLVVPSQ